MSRGEGGKNEGLKDRKKQNKNRWVIIGENFSSIYIVLNLGKEGQSWLSGPSHAKKGAKNGSP